MVHRGRRYPNSDNAAYRMADRAKLEANRIIRAFPEAYTSSASEAVFDEAGE